MKLNGQTQIVSFIMFFMIGLALFLSIGGVFRGRLDFFTEDIADANRKLTNSYFSAIAINEMAGCKQCDNVNISTKLENVTAGFFLQAQLSESGLSVITQPGGKAFTTNLHNFLFSLVEVNGTGTSTQPIILSYSKNQNKLRVVQ